MTLMPTTPTATNMESSKTHSLSETKSIPGRSIPRTALPSAITCQVAARHLPMTTTCENASSPHGRYTIPPSHLARVKAPCTGVNRAATNVSATTMTEMTTLPHSQLRYPKQPALLASLAQRPSVRSSQTPLVTSSANTVATFPGLMIRRHPSSPTRTPRSDVQRFAIRTRTVLRRLGLQSLDVLLAIIS